MAGQRSKSTGETPRQQRAHGKSISTIVKQNARQALAGRARNTVEKARMTKKR